jgi:hypothetical protein
MSHAILACQSWGGDALEHASIAGIAEEKQPHRFPLTIVDRRNAYSSDASLVLRLPGRMWRQLQRPRLLCLLDDSMPHELPLDEIAATPEATELAVELAALQLQGDQRVYLWLEDAAKVEGREGIASSKVGIYVGSEPGKYHALAVAMAHQRSDLQALAKQLSACRVEGQVLLEKAKLEPDGAKLAASTQSLDQVLRRLRAGATNLQQWLLLFDDNNSISVRKRVIAIPAQLNSAAAHAEQALASSLAQLAASTTTDENQAALRAADVALEQLSAVLDRNLRELAKAEGYFEAVSQLQHILETQQRIQDQTNQERRERVQQLWE